MTRAQKWRCGLAHDHIGDHGDWVDVSVYKREKWRCGEIAQAPQAEREGVLYGCPWPECEFVHPGSGPARGHWYTHIRERDRTFNSIHGTEAGYQYHLKQLKENACDDCAEAHRVNNREWARQWRRGYGGRGMGGSPMR